MREAAVAERDVAQGEADAVHRVVGEPAGPGERGAGRGERGPGAAGGVGRAGLHGVQQVREPAEQAPGLGERCGVARPSGQVRGVGEGRGGGGLGRFGDGEDRRPGSGERLDAGLPVHGVDQDGGVEADVGPGPGAGAAPARGHLARGERHGAAGQQSVAVGHMVAHLGGGEHQGDGRGEPGALAPGDGGGAHPAQRARPGGAPQPPVLAVAALGLSLCQDGYEQPVVVRHDPRELSVVAAQGQAQPAQMSRPLGGEAFPEPVTAGPDDSEHDDPPWCVRR